MNSFRWSTWPTTTAAARRLADGFEPDGVTGRNWVAWVAGDGRWGCVAARSAARNARTSRSPASSRRAVLARLDVVGVGASGRRGPTPSTTGKTSRWARPTPGWSFSPDAKSIAWGRVGADSPGGESDLYACLVAGGPLPLTRDGSLNPLWADGGCVDGERLGRPRCAGLHPDQVSPTAVACGGSPVKIPRSRG